MRILLSVVLFLVAARPTFGQIPEGFVPLFNGKDLTGWKAVGNPKVWGAEDGVLFVNGGGGGWLLSEKDYANFDLRLEYKMPKMGNSGVGLRTPLPGQQPKGKGWDPAYVGMEIQLLDDPNWKGLAAWQHTGSIYHVVPAKKVNGRPFGEWNQMKIVADRKKILIEQNGEVLVDADLADYEKDHARRNPGILRETGKIGLQSYNFRVEFKNLAIKTLE